MVEKDILRITDSDRTTFNDAITDEVFLTLYLNEQELLTLLCSPDSLKELCAGFLFSAGLIHSFDDIETISVNTSKMISRIKTKKKEMDKDIMFRRVYTSGCGKNMLFYNTLDITGNRIIQNNTSIRSTQIQDLMKDFEKRSVSYKKTGGVHGAALCSADKIIVFHEDIGRHNAIDKIVGEALIRKLNMKDMVVLTSGRISSEVMYKVQKMGSAVVISRSAPTSLAVNLAEKWNVALVGFVRGRRMNVYTASERIL
ncbi:formate dehydrogenase accessory sulfurtransferase FdhD [Candidatus Latescibacterota bacterium]